jgi:hypothetical protein
MNITDIKKQAVKLSALTVDIDTGGIEVESFTWGSNFGTECTLGSATNMDVEEWNGLPRGWDADDCVVMQLEDVLQLQEAAEKPDGYTEQAITKAMRELLFETVVVGSTGQGLPIVRDPEAIIGELFAKLGQ